MVQSGSKLEVLVASPSCTVTTLYSIHRPASKYSLRHSLSLSLTHSFYVHLQWFHKFLQSFMVFFFCTLDCPCCRARRMRCELTDGVRCSCSRYNGPASRINEIRCSNRDTDDFHRTIRNEFSTREKIFYVRKESICGRVETRL